MAELDAAVRGVLCRAPSPLSSGAVAASLPAYLLCGMAVSENSHLPSWHWGRVFLPSLTSVKSGLVFRGNDGERVG